MKTLAQLKDRKAAIPAEMQAIVDAEDGDNLTEEAQASFDALKAESADLNTAIATAETLEKETAEAATNEKVTNPLHDEKKGGAKKNRTRKLKGNEKGNKKGKRKRKKNNK